MKLTRRSAADADVDFARALHTKCYREIVTTQFGSWDEPLQSHFFQLKWNEGGAELIELNGAPVGLVATHWRPDHLLVSEIQVAPSYQGRGIGSLIMSELIAEANARKLPIRLQVLLLSRARVWYDRLGFESTGQSETHLTLERPFEG